MIGVGTQYVSKWLWGAGEGPRWFLNYTFSSGLEKSKKRGWGGGGELNCIIYSQLGQTKLLPWGSVQRRVKELVSCEQGSGCRGTRDNERQDTQRRSLFKNDTLRNPFVAGCCRSEAASPREEKTPTLQCFYWWKQGNRPANEPPQTYKSLFKIKNEIL